MLNHLRWKVVLVVILVFAALRASDRLVQASPLRQDTPDSSSQAASPPLTVTTALTSSVTELFDPLPAQTAQLEAGRQALFSLGKGDQLDREGNREAAREQWLLAAAAYLQAEDGLGEADAYLRLANSYLPSVLGCIMAATANPYSHSADSCVDELGMDDLLQMLALRNKRTFRVATGYYVEALSAAARVYEELIQREIPVDPDVLAQADASFGQAMLHYQLEDCQAAYPLLEQARQLYVGQQFGSGEMRALTIKALCQLEDGSFESMATLLQAFSIASTLPLGTPTTELYLEAGHQYERGDFQGALTTYEKVLNRYQTRAQESDQTENIAQTMHELGNVNARLGNYQVAEEWYRQGLDLFRTIENEYDEHNQAAAYHNLGNLATLNGRYGEAFDWFAQAIQLWKAIGDPVNEVNSLSSLSLALRGLGHYDEAFSVLERAQALYQQLPEDLETEGDLLNNQAAIYHQIGDYPTALQLFQQSLQLRRQLPLPQKQIESLINIARTNLSLARFEEALDGYQTVLAQATALKLRDLEMFARYQIAMLQFLQADYQASINTFLDVLSYYEQMGHTLDEANVRFFLSIAYMAIGNPSRAEFHLNGAQALLADADNPEWEMISQLGFALLYTQVGNSTQGNTFIEKTLKTLQRTGNKAALSQLWASLAGDAYIKGDLASARTYLTEALALAEQSGTPLNQQALQLLDELITYAAHGDVAALTRAQQRLTHSTRTMALSSEALGLLLVYAHLQAHDYQQAYIQLEQVIQELEVQQATLTAAEFKRSFVRQQSAAYALAVVLAFLNDQPEQAFQYAEQARARTFLEQLTNQQVKFGGGDGALMQKAQTLEQRLGFLQQALDEARTATTQQEQPLKVEALQDELTVLRNDYTELLAQLEASNRDYADLLMAKVVTLQEVQGLLDPETTLVLYFTIPQNLVDQTIAWIIDKEQIEVIALPVTPAKVTEWVDLLRKQLTSRDDSTAVTTELYDWLIRPLQPFIHHANLIIAPHGALNYLPFAALWNAEQQKHLIEEYTLSYIPSASSLPLLQQRRNANRGNLLALGNPDHSLPNAETEVTAIAKLYETQPFIHEQATETLLYTQAESVDILHLAAHGVYNPFNPLFTRLELAADAQHDGNVEVHEIYNLDLSAANLVVLSACDSGQAELTDGEEIVGLPRAFLYAGAPAVITTLWGIDDAASALLMESFYTHFQAGLNPAAALRAAQLAVLAEDKWQSPYYWAAFSLHGDYQGGVSQ